MTVPLRAATHARHYEAPCQLTDTDGTRHWITRAAEPVAVVSDAKKGARLERQANPDEYLLLLPPAMEASLSAGEQSLAAHGDSLTIIPPGASVVEVATAGTVVRVFSNKAADILGSAGNAAIYADGAAEVAPLVAWPDPVGGFRIRHYPLSELSQSRRESR